MIVNIQIDLGYGLTEYVESLGYSLCQRGTTWHLDGPNTEAEAQSIIDLYNPWPYEKTQKLIEINEAFQNAVNALTAGTTEGERNSWAIQEREAREYPNKQPVALQILATSRGIALEQLVDKVIQKSNLYQQHYFALQGIRDKAEDTVKSFSDNDSLDKLELLTQVKFE